MPDLLDWHDQDDHIRKDVRHRVPNKRTLQIDTIAFSPWYPRFVYRIALEYADERDGYTPGQDNRADGVGANLEAAAREDAEVHG